MQRHEGGYYVRMSVFDRPGRWPSIATRMGERQISLEAIMQKRPHKDAPSSGSAGRADHPCDLGGHDPRGAGDDGQRRGRKRRAAGDQDREVVRGAATRVGPLERASGFGAKRWARVGLRRSDAPYQHVQEAPRRQALSFTITPPELSVESANEDAENVSAKCKASAPAGSARDELGRRRRNDWGSSPARYPSHRDSFAGRFYRRLRSPQFRWRT